MSSPINEPSRNKLLKLLNEHAKTRRAEPTQEGQTPSQASSDGGISLAGLYIGLEQPSESHSKQDILAEQQILANRSGSEHGIDDDEWVELLNQDDDKFRATFSGDEGVANISKLSRVQLMVVAKKLAEMKGASEAELNKAFRDGYASNLADQDADLFYVTGFHRAVWLWSRADEMPTYVKSELMKHAGSLSELMKHAGSLSEHLISYSKDSDYPKPLKHCGQPGHLYGLKADERTPEGHPSLVYFEELRRLVREEVKRRLRQ